MSLTPIEYTWGSAATYRPNLPLDTARPLYGNTFDAAPLTGVTTQAQYEINIPGEGIPSSGVAGGAWVAQFNGVPGIAGYRVDSDGSAAAGPYTAQEIILDAALEAAGGITGVGVGLIGSDGRYAMGIVRTDSWTISVRKGDNSGASDNASGAIPGGGGASLIAGTRVLVTVCRNNLALLIKRPADADYVLLGCAYVGSTVAAGYEPAAGYIDQTDPAQATGLHPGWLVFATAESGNATVSLRSVDAAYFGAVSIRETFPVVKASDGGSIYDENGRILTTVTTQGLNDNTNANACTWWGTAWYDPATGEFSDILCRFVSARDGLLVGDSDGMIMYDDRPASADHGKSHVWLVTTGTNRQTAGSDPVENTYRIVHQLIDIDLTEDAGGVVVLSGQSTVTFPAGTNPNTIGATYDTKIRLINGTWYCAGTCSAGAPSVAPTSLFIVSGDSPTNFTTIIRAPAYPASDNYEGSSVQRMGGVWYAFISLGSSGVTTCYDLMTGDEVGEMDFGDLPGQPFVPHCTIVPVLTTDGGQEKTEWRRLAHNSDFDNYGDTLTTNSWVFGDAYVQSANELQDGWEFPRYQIGDENNEDSEAARRARVRRLYGWAQVNGRGHEAERREWGRITPKSILP